MNRCDWLGPICMTNKDADRMVGVDFVLADGTTRHFGEGHEIGLNSDGYFVDDERLGWPTSVSPIFEPGAEITVRRGCAKRQGHRGDHGFYWWRRWVRRLGR